LPPLLAGSHLLSQTMPVRGIYRSPSHLPIWAVLQAGGIWEEVGIELTSFEYVDESSVAERLLLSGEIDFISGNHISTYTQFRHGQPIVHLTSPSNAVHDALVTRQPIQSLTDLRGKRIGETAQLGPEGGYAHNRGNHLLTLKRQGVEPEKTDRILADLTKREGESRPYARERILRMPRKPYPELPAVANAYELACIQHPETRDISPLSLWNLHYLRELDDSGFIDRLYA